MEVQDQVKAQNYKSRKSNNLMKTIQLKINKQDEDELLNILRWRQNTQFPIVRVDSIKINFRTNNYAIIQISHESQFICLQEISEFSLNQVLYILRQSSIGFERLFQQFGYFRLTPKMICINNQRLCKVWINSNFGCNQPNRYECNNGNQKKFLRELSEMLKLRCCQSILVSQLFNRLQNANSFIYYKKIIENFVNEKKLSIPCKYIEHTPNAVKFYSPIKTNKSPKSIVPPQKYQFNLLKSTKQIEKVSQINKKDLKINKSQVQIDKSKSNLSQKSEKISFKTSEVRNHNPFKSSTTKQQQSEENNPDSQLHTELNTLSDKELKMSESICDGTPDIYINKISTNELFKLGKMGRNILKSMVSFDFDYNSRFSSQQNGQKKQF